jgi:hypothetical protein
MAEAWELLRPALGSGAGTAFFERDDMADESPQQTAQEQGPDEPRADAGSSTGRFVKKLFNKKEGETVEGQPVKPERGIAQIPSTVLTVEYIDDSEGMDAALTELSERLRRVEEQAVALQQTQGRLVAAVNQQAKDIGRILESLSRRIDRLYRRVGGGGSTTATPASPAASRQAPQPTTDESTDEVTEVTEGMSAHGSVAGLAPDVADNPEHQNAWRVARVLAADLEGYHEEAVREGVLYGTFYSVLREPIEKARQTYEERVSREIVEECDYFSRALDELVIRKRMELEEEGAL